VDLSGAVLSDAVGVRHVFSEDTQLAPEHTLVVFSAGSPSFDATATDLGAHCTMWPAEVASQTASTGRLALNNSGDSLLLTNAEGALLASASYGPEGGDDRSLTRSPDRTPSSWALHDEVAGTIGSLSPGTSADGSALASWDTTTEDSG
jgi:hypothetical protein